MNFKTTIVLLFLLVCAGVFVFIAHDRAKNETAKPVEKHKLLDFTTSDLNRVVITATDGKRTALERVDNKWRLTEPVNARADDSQVRGILDDITALIATAEVPTSGSDAPKTGLDQPQYKIELTATGNPTTLLVGNKLAVTDGVYVQVTGQKQADVVPAGFLDKLDDVAKTVRDKKLVEASQNQIQQLVLTRPDGRVVLHKKAGEWEIVEPTAVAADSGNVTSLLAALTELKAVDFDAGHARLTGLKSPVLSVYYSTQAPSTQPAATEKSKTPFISDTIRFGDFADAMQKNVFAQAGAATGSAADATPTAIARVSADSLNSLNKGLVDLRTKAVLDIEPREVSQFSVKTDIAATTQPTTKPAKSTLITLVHHVVTPPPLPATRPSAPLAATQASTHPAAATQASTHPASATQAIAHAAPAKQAATAPVAIDEWLFTSPKSGTANRYEVSLLLSALHPLNADKFIEKPDTEKPVAQYVLKVTTIGPGGAPVTEYTIEVADPGHDRPLEGRYNGLTFELPRKLLTDLQSDFTDQAARTPAPPREPNDERSFPPGH